jgi:hypothetical protein
MAAAGLLAMYTADAQAPVKDIVEPPAPFNPLNWDWYTILVTVLVALVVGVVFRSIVLAKKVNKL